MNIEYTYKRTKEDFKIHAIWNRFFKTPFNILLNFIMPVLAVLSLLLYGSQFFAEMYFLVAYLILFPLLNYVFTLFAVNRVVNKDGLEFDETTFVYDNEGITIKSTKGELTLEYPRIVDVYITKAYIYIYVSRTDAFLVNKEAIGLDKSNAIIELLEKYCLPRTVHNRNK